MADKKPQGEEKVQAMLNRWVNMKREMALGELTRRPTNPYDLDNLSQCLGWRTQVMQEMAIFITDIQNAALGEHKLRALNDEINRLLREKSLWEDRIRQLGGPDFKQVSVRQVDSQGQEIPGAEGYLYYGAAKDLPGVREFLQRPPPVRPSKNIQVLRSRVDEGYFRSQEDERIMEKEREEEEKGWSIDLKKKRVLDYEDNTLRWTKEANEKYLGRVV
jgi:pre-mRNA-splicing factor ISY1